jgi:two-component sensor histidine kinase
MSKHIKKKKRKSFISIFLKKLIIYVIPAVVISFSLFMYIQRDTLFGSNNYIWKFEELSDEIKDLVINKGGFESNRTEIDRKLCSSVENWLENYMADSYLVIFDAKTGEVLSDSTLKFFATYHDSDKDGSEKDIFMELHEDESENGFDPYADIKAPCKKARMYRVPENVIDYYICHHNMLKGLDSYVTINGAYIDIEHSEFIPSSATVMSDYDGSDYKSRLEINFDNTDKEHFSKKCTENEISWFYCQGTSDWDSSPKTRFKSDEFINRVITDADIQAELDSNKFTTKGIEGYLPPEEWDMTKDYSTDITMYKFKEESGREYIILGMTNSKYTLFLYKPLKILIYVFFCTLGVIIALISSLISYNTLKAFYKREDYRKALTDSLAHDLKTPLMVISGYAENLKENVHTEKREHYADAITETTRYMNEMVSDIMELSKLEDEAKAVERSKIDLVSIISELEEKYKTMLEEKNISFTTDGQYIAKVNEMQMRRVMENLLTNAIKYTHPDGYIKVTGDKKKFVIRNAIIDEITVAPEKLWEPFFKGDDSRGKSSGSGIGLSIVRYILEANKLKGKIDISEEEFSLMIKK